MLLLSAAKAVAVAAVGSVALSSGRNMLQTYRISSSSSSLVPPPLPDNPTTVKGLQTLSRHELLKLYLYTCQAPRDLEQLNGDWNGVLLQNGFLLTAISRFVANRLFGKGRRWNGKSFDCSAAAAAAAEQQQQPSGINRFETFSQIKDRKSGSGPPTWTVVAKTEEDQCFDLALAESRLLRGSKGTHQQQQQQRPFVAMLRYAQHHRRLSPWRGMVDEVRVVPGTDDKLLLGWGNLGWWAGGVLNASPFCLYRSQGSWEEKRKRLQ